MSVQIGAFSAVDYSPVVWKRSTGISIVDFLNNKNVGMTYEMVDYVAGATKSNKFDTVSVHKSMVSMYAGEGEQEWKDMTGHFFRINDENEIIEVNFYNGRSTLRYEFKGTRWNRRDLSDAGYTPPDDKAHDIGRKCALFLKELFPGQFRTFPEIPNGERVTRSKGPAH